jgi:hypothetical protein
VAASGIDQSGTVPEVDQVHRPVFKSRKRTAANLKNVTGDFHPHVKAIS